jgi:hypothetical protein
MAPFSVHDGSAEIVIDISYTVAVSCKQSSQDIAAVAIVCGYSSVGRLFLACSLHWLDLANMSGIGLYSWACIRTSTLAFHILARELQAHAMLD